MAIVALSGESVGGEAARGVGLRPAESHMACQRPAPRTWQGELRLAVRDPAQLIAALQLPAELIDAAEKAAKSFPLFAPWPYIARMKKGDPADPLLRQVLPLGDELAEQPGFASDPVGDGSAQLMPGLLQKYHGRALLITTGACAVHC